LLTRRQLIASGAGALAAAAQAQSGSRHLILVTADGLRWQDLFTGIDAGFMKEKSIGMGEGKPAEALRQRFWKPTPEERRLALLPFFWGRLAPQGVVLGNVTRKSSVQVTNRYRVSYPGYSELLTGRAQDEVIRGNDPIQNPTPSFLQFLKNHWKLSREQAAVFSSWEVFRQISESKPGELYLNTGYEASTLPKANARVAELNRLQNEIKFVSDGARNDAFTFHLAMEYLKALRPRLLYIAFDETDDWAHSKRYDRTLESIAYFDKCLEELWSWVQRTPPYKDTTTLIVTCDHGRGATLEDWHGHGARVAGAEQIWLAVIGPDTPASGELSNTATYYQRDIAPTALSLLGVDPALYTGVLGKPIPVVRKGS
jgi:hypothetical protein